MKQVLLFDLVDKQNTGLRIPAFRENSITNNTREELEYFIDISKSDLESKFGKTHYIEFVMAWSEQDEVDS